MFMLDLFLDSLLVNYKHILFINKCCLVLYSSQIMIHKQLVCETTTQKNVELVNTLKM